MKAYELFLPIKEDGSFEIPARLRNVLKREETVRILILTAEQDDKDWKEFAAREFIKGYDDTDSVYDDMK
jgi:hypothetical protein